MTSAAPGRILYVPQGAQGGTLLSLASVLQSPLDTVAIAAAAELVGAGRASMVLVEGGASTAEHACALQALAILRALGSLPIVILDPGSIFPVEQAYATGASDVMQGPLLPAALNARIASSLASFSMQAERQRSEVRYRTLFESMDDGVCMIDVMYDAAGRPCDYRFIEVNPAFVKHTGLADAVGKTITSLAPGHEAHWYETYGRVAATGRPERFINEARALDRWYDVYATRVGGEGSHRVAVLFTDITERVKADAELHRLATDLATADRRKTEFLATLAHELRNPLAPIRSGLHVMRMSNGNPEVSARVQDVMERQLNHLVALVDDLLDIARITRGQVDIKPERIDVARVLTSAVETSMPLIDAQVHQLVLELPDEPLTLFADPTRIRQIVSNLLNNSAKYTPRGGRIILAARQHDGELLLTVSDNGIGIDADRLDEVFDMFNQVGRARDPSAGGLGIGLSLVRSLVQLHGGSVEAASAGPGRGSVFTVRLPLDQASPAAAPADAAAPQTEPLRAGLRVMVVDDNRDAASTLAELLGLIGHTVSLANSGPEALELAPGFVPDVIFLDIGMPGMNGYQTAAALRREPCCEGCLLVALTGWGGEDDRQRSADAGFDLHLTKPVNLDAVAGLLSDRAATLTSRKGP